MMRLLQFLAGNWFKLCLLVLAAIAVWQQRDAGRYQVHTVGDYNGVVTLDTRTGQKTWRNIGQIFKGVQ